MDVPSRDALYVIGRSTIRMDGKPDRIVKNGFVDYDGEIISSEE